MRYVSKIEIGHSMIKNNNKHTMSSPNQDYHGIFKVITAKPEDRAAIIEKHKDKINVVDLEQKTTPLHLALYHGKTDVANMLLDNGANVNIVNGYGNKPIFNYLYGWKGTHRGKLLRRLLDLGADTGKSILKNYNAMEIATCKKRYKAIQILLDRNVERDINVDGCCGMFSKCIDHANIEKMMLTTMRCANCQKKGEVLNVCGCYDFKKGMGLCAECFEKMKPAMKCGVCSKSFAILVNLSNVEKLAIAFAVVMFAMMLLGRITPIDYTVANIAAVLMTRFVLGGEIRFFDRPHAYLSVGVGSIATVMVIINSVLYANIAYLIACDMLVLCAFIVCDYFFCNQFRTIETSSGSEAAVKSFYEFAVGKKELYSIGGVKK
jgi:hypothetical protein